MKNKPAYQSWLLIILSAVSFALMSLNLYLSRRDQVKLSIVSTQPHEQN